MGWSIEPRRKHLCMGTGTRGYDSSSFAEAILEKAGVIITPGIGYGEYGKVISGLR